MRLSGIVRAELGKPARALAAAGLLIVATAMPAFARDNAATDDISAQRRPRVTIYPRGHYYPGPNAKRYCQSWLEREYRVSGTVIVPRMRCEWR